MAEWLRLVVDSLVIWVHQHGASICRAMAILWGTEPVSALTHALFILRRSR